MLQGRLSMVIVRSGGDPAFVLPRAQFLPAAFGSAGAGEGRAQGRCCAALPFEKGSRSILGARTPLRFVLPLFLGTF